jgi:hypothetical protein
LLAFGLAAFGLAAFDLVAFDFAAFGRGFRGGLRAAAAGGDGRAWRGW